MHCGYNESWLTPDIEGVISSDLPFEKFTITIRHSDGKEIKTELDKMGRFHFNAIRDKTFTAFPGDRCENSQLELSMNQNTIFTHHVCICTGDLVPSNPPSLLLVAIQVSKPTIAARDKYLSSLYRNAYTVEELLEIRKNLEDWMKP